MAYEKKAPEGARQGRLTEKGKAQTKTQPKADDWTLKGWLNVSKSGSMIKVSLGEGEQAEFIGLVSVKQAERMLNGEIKGIPIKLPPAQEQNDPAED